MVIADLILKHTMIPLNPIKCLHVILWWLLCYLVVFSTSNLDVTCYICLTSIVDTVRAWTDKEVVRKCEMKSTQVSWKVRREKLRNIFNRFQHPNNIQMFNLLFLSFITFFLLYKDGCRYMLPLSFNFHINVKDVNTIYHSFSYPTIYLSTLAQMIVSQLHCFSSIYINFLNINIQWSILGIYYWKVFISIFLMLLFEL